MKPRQLNSSERGFSLARLGIDIQIMDFVGIRNMIIGHAVRSYSAEQNLNLHCRIEMHTAVSVHHMSSVLCRHGADCTKSVYVQS